MPQTLASRIALVRDRVERAATRAGRDPAEIRLIAVSKTHTAAAVREAIAAGLSDFGENKVQEGEAKIAEIRHGSITWHLIGHLQANKARKAVRSFGVLHSLDSIELAERLDRICDEEGRRLPVLIQVDLAGETTKSGVPVGGLDALASAVRSSENLDLLGLMLLPPHFEDPEATRPYFRRLREIRDKMMPGSELSMGMSHDFEVAIEEGSTMIRVGTAIFGDRE